MVKMLERNLGGEDVPQLFQSEIILSLGRMRLLIGCCGDTVDINIGGDGYDFVVGCGMGPHIPSQ